MDEKLLNEIIKEYQDELKELEEIRRKRSETYAQMTEEEFIENYVAELKAVEELAEKEGLPVLRFPIDDEDDE